MLFKMKSSYYRRILSLILLRRENAITIYRLLRRVKRIKHDFSKVDDSNVPLPMIITVRLTNRCNLRCRHCGQWGQGGVYNDAKVKDLLSEELTTRQWINFFDQIADFKPYIFIAGGEPLLREDLAEIIAFASSRGLLVGLNSNCTLLSPAVAQNLVQSRLAYFYASLDGPKDIHNSMRLGKDAFEKTTEGLGALLAVRSRLKQTLPIIQLDTVITPDNQQFLFETAQIAEELGVDAFGLILSIFTTQEFSDATCLWYERKFGIKAKYWQGFVKDMSGIDGLILQAQLERIKHNRWNFKFRPFIPIGKKGFDFREYFHHPEIKIGDGRCFSPWVFSQIMPNGDVATCGNHPDYVVGNISQNKFSEIWNNEASRKFRSVLRGDLPPACNRCLGLFMFSK